MTTKCFYAEIRQKRTGEVEGFKFSTYDEKNAREIVDLIYGKSEIWEIISISEIVKIQNSNPIVKIKIIEETFLN